MGHQGNMQAMKQAMWSNSHGSLRKNFTTQLYFYLPILSSSRSGLTGEREGEKKKPWQSRQQPAQRQHFSAFVLLCLPLISRIHPCVEMPIVLAHVSRLPFSFSSFTDFIYLPIPSFVFPHLDIFFPPNGLFFHSLTHTESTGLAIKVSKNTINMNPLAFRLVCAHMCVCV